MDISKLKEGVISLSAFLVGHVAWLVATIYSIRSAFGPQFETKILEISTNTNSMLQNDTIIVLLDTYGLKPLIPAFVLFTIIFVLYAHKELLEGIGRYIPPEIVWHWMPGMRDISPGRWYYVLGQLGSNYSFDRVRTIVEARYPEAIKEYNIPNYSSAFNIFKSLALMNVIFGFISISKFNTSTFLLFCTFSIAATITALLQIYHYRNQSRWAIDKVLSNLLAENALDIHNIKNEKAYQLTEHERDAVKNFLKADQQQPICSLSWSIPLIGNLRILRETFFRTPSETDKRKYDV